MVHSPRGRLGHDEENMKRVQSKIKRSPQKHRKKPDMENWLAWRLNVNDEISKYISSTEARETTQPINFFPKVMKQIAIQNIIGYAYNTKRTKSSLDEISFLVYGIPRVNSSSIILNGNTEEDYSSSIVLSQIIEKPKSQNHGPRGFQKNLPVVISTINVPPISKPDTDDSLYPPADYESDVAEAAKSHLKQNTNGHKHKTYGLVPTPFVLAGMQR